MKRFFWNSEFENAWACTVQQRLKVVWTDRFCFFPSGHVFFCARRALGRTGRLTAIRRMGLIAVTPVLFQTHAMRVFADCDAKLRRGVQNENLSLLARTIAVLFHSIACLVLLCVIRSN